MDITIEQLKSNKTYIEKKIENNIVYINHETIIINRCATIAASNRHRHLCNDYLNENKKLEKELKENKTQIIHYLTIFSLSLKEIGIYKNMRIMLCKTLYNLE